MCSPQIILSRKYFTPITLQGMKLPQVIVKQLYSQGYSYMNPQLLGDIKVYVDSFN